MFPLHIFLAYSTLHCYTIYRFYTQLCVNNVEVTVNTCTCTDLFTVITTKDQSGGIYNSYSTGDQEFMAVVNKPRPRTRSVYCHKSLALHCAITITYHIHALLKCIPLISASVKH